MKHVLQYLRVLHLWVTRHQVWVGRWEKVLTKTAVSLAPWRQGAGAGLGSNKGSTLMAVTLGLITGLCLSFSSVNGDNKSIHLNIPRLIAFHRYCILLQTESVWQPCIEQVYWCHISNSICSLAAFVSHLAFLNNISKVSLVAQMVRSLLVMQETWVQSLGQEDPLEKEMATHSSILDWKIPWTEEPTVHGLQSMGSWRVGHNWVTNTHHHQKDYTSLKAWVMVNIF